MSTSTIPADVAAYLRQVRERLSDLPGQEREDLLADVEPSVLESAGESDVPVELRLGPPDRFADELRAAAGLPPRAEASARRTPLRERARAAAAALRPNSGLWWVVAAYAGLAGVGMSQGGPRAQTTFALAAGALVLAAALTVARRAAPRWLVVVLAAGVLPVVVGLSDRTVYVGSVAVDPSEGLAYRGLPVDNVYAFDRRGRPLQDVRLYDSSGQALAIGPDDPDPSRRVPRTRDGERAFNAFPIRYFEHGTRRIADPRAGVPEAPAPIVTPPVK